MISPRGFEAQRQPAHSKAHQAKARFATLMIAALITLATLCLGLAPANALTQTRKTSFQYSSTTGLLTREVIEPDTASFKVQTDYTYDSFGNRLTTTVSGTDIVTRTTAVAYDTRGEFATTITNALAQSETWTYDPALGVPTSQTGPNGLTTTWQYDGLGRNIQVTYPDGNKVTYSPTFCYGYHDGPSYATCATGLAFYVFVLPRDSSNAQNGPSQSIQFDELSRQAQIAVEGADGGGYSVHRTINVFDSQGRLAQKSLPYLEQTETPVWVEYDYDALGRVVQETHPDASDTSYSYNGLTTSSTNDLSQTRTTVRNARGQIATVADNAGTLEYAYDAFGNLLHVLDTDDNATVNTYNIRGHKLSTRDPDMGTWTYAYNVLGELVSQTDAKGQTTTLAYDKLGRPTGRVEAGLTSTWAYDSQTKGVGKLASATTNTGYARVPSYDSYGRSSSTQVTIDSTNYTSSVTYDANGRVDTATRASGFVVKYLYTVVGALSQVKDNATSNVLWTANTHNAAQQLTQATLGNGVVINQAFDTDTGTIDTIQAGTSNGIANFAFAFDVIGNLTSRQDHNVEVVTSQHLNESFSYDNLNRLTGSSIVSGATKAVTYDTLGNILTKTKIGGGGVNTYSYPAAQKARPHALSYVTGTVNGETNPDFSYDLNGNMTTGAGRSVTYTSFNKVATITQGVETVAFTYNGEHKRIKQVTSSETTLYLGSTEKVIGTSSNVTWKDYIMAGGKRVALRAYEVNTTTTTWRYFIHDHLGSTAIVLNDAGGIVERLSYDAWGKRRFANGADDATGSVVSEISRGFTGHEHIPGIGLINMNARVYDPELGRFMSPDSVNPAPGLSQSYNRYAYVINNPLSLTDPSGHSWFSKNLKKVGNFFKKNPLARVIVGIAAAATLNFQILPALIQGATHGLLTAAELTLNAVISGAVSGGITGGDLKSVLIGAATAFAFTQIHFLKGAGVFGEGLTKNVTSAFAHGVVGGASSTAGGGKFKSGFFSGFVGNIIPLTCNNLCVRDVVVSAASGGAASVAGGGKFANGAVTAAFGYLYNEAAGKGGITCSNCSDTEKVLLRNTLENIENTGSKGSYVVSRANKLGVDVLIVSGRNEGGPGQVNWDPYTSLSNGTEILSATSILAHELGHAIQNERTWGLRLSQTCDDNNCPVSMDNMEENFVITYYENPVAEALGDWVRDCHTCPGTSEIYTVRVVRSEDE